MKIVRVEGKNNKHKVFMYALSTCAWCKMTKQFLKDSGIEYEYVDVDLCEEDEKARIRKDIVEKGGEITYPTVIVDDETLIAGFRKDKIKEALEL